MNSSREEIQTLLTFTFLDVSALSSTMTKTISKFDEKYDEGIFHGYSFSCKAYRIYNKITLTNEDSMHVSFDESNPSKEDIVVCDDVDDDDEILEVPMEDIAKNNKVDQMEQKEETT